ncbi:hypothetical protein [Massilibacteroides sp.]|uniref:hypothetical protein n=1 Tax=Massilibacteroides sp. TaxID=2034766 RepID=UPI00261593FB|nr:hypothetical protein [Massilibacteroides sp.]MDD4513977.1 hypothetical protein [Massilibacteroides sp.]
MVAQFVNYGTDPASLKWKQVRTNHYKLIYPDGNDSIAYNYARFLETVYPYETKTIGHAIKRHFPVILHPGNMLSNGMVAYAPRRMEMLSTPSPTLYGQRWDRQLVIHESRHVLQTDKLMQGVFRPFYYLFGEQVSGISSFAVPSWFFEGDAVATETAMSKSGRGRLPEFHMPFRAQMIGGRFFSFDKWYMGSYKDYTSSFYGLGYHMTSYARYAYGEDVWDKVTYRFPRRFFSVPPFSNALKHYTGSNTSRLFKDTYTFLNKEWTRQDSLYYRSGFEEMRQVLSPEPKLYTSYRYPVAIDKETILALKSGLQDINALVQIRDGNERRLTYLGSINGRLIYSQNKVYWTEYVYGLRWTHRNYSVLKCFDMQTGKTNVLTEDDRLLAPALDPAGKKMAVSRPNTDGHNEVLIMTLASGKITAEFDVPENAFVKDMVFTGDNRLAVLVVGDQGTSLLELDCAASRWKELLGPVSVNISSLCWKEGDLYFESGADGTNNIYCMEIASGKLEQITNVRFGAFNPSLSEDGKTLLFADYEPKGYRVASVEIEKLNKIPTDLDNPYRFELAETIASQENFNLDTVELKDIPFDPKPYRKVLNLFGVHSWAPFYYDVMDVVNMSGDDFTSVVKPGAMIISQNALNTMIMQAGWYYDESEHHGKVGLTYMGWLPVIDMTVDYGGKTFDLSWKKDEEGKVYGVYERADRQRIEAEARVYIPFNLTRNYMIRGFQPSVTYFYTNDKYQQYKSGRYGNFQYLLSELRYYNYRAMASRDIYPRLGYQIRLQHLFSPFNTENYGHMYAARLTAYLPGVRINDGLMLRFGYQYQDMDGKALFFPKRLLEEPRGYDYIYQTRQMFSAKADYAFSIFCPDFSIGNLAYLKRFRSNLFYDFTANQINKDQKKWNTYNAVGADFILDCNLFRLNFPVGLGVRITAPLDYGSTQVESLFSMSF